MYIGVYDSSMLYFWLGGVISLLCVLLPFAMRRSKFFCYYYYKDSVTPPLQQPPDLHQHHLAGATPPAVGVIPSSSPTNGYGSNDSLLLLSTEATAHEPSVVSSSSSIKQTGEALTASLTTYQQLHPQLITVEAGSNNEHDAAAASATVTVVHTHIIGSARYYCAILWQLRSYLFGVCVCYICSLALFPGVV
jgi:hypothetical protein